MTVGPRRLAAVAALVGAVLVAGACSDLGDLSGDGGDCTPVHVAVSSEKIALITDLAADFNDSDLSEGPDGCWFVEAQSKPSGGAAELLSTPDGWDESIDGPRPTVWSPASSAWGGVVNERLASLGAPPIVGEARPFMLTPLVIAMPQPMAEALGWPDEPIGFADILELSTSEEGWSAFGHPEWGPFKLGKTNPNFSTSGLSMAVAQYSALAGKTGDLTVEDLRRDDVVAATEAIEQAVVHYGDTTLTFLNNWYRADARGTALSYASAAAVEEVSVIQYNQGNPDGRLDPGEVPAEPRVPLVAVYPAEGTLFSDNPLIVLDADWVTPEARQGAERFADYVQQPENQQRVLEFGFRPGNPEVPLADPIVAAYGADPAQPQALLEVPDPEVLIGVIDEWELHRKGARVLMVVDISGSMGDPAADGLRDTKLDLAKAAAVRSLDQFAADDEVGLRVFTTGISVPAGSDLVAHPDAWVELVAPAPISANRTDLVSAIEGLFPQEGTPLYTATGDAYVDASEDFDPERINAVVVLSDGQNEDVNDDLDGLLDTLSEGREGNPFPVRVFTIAYGDGADLATLQEIAEATDAAVYDSADPTSIDKVFTAVISNF